MQIHQLLTEETVRVGLSGGTKEEVLADLISLLKPRDEVINVDAVRDAVFARESVMSTGVGKGLALPHAKTSAVSGTVAAFAISKAPVEYGSIDNEPVSVFFLLVGTEEAKSQHIKLLSRVSRLMNRDAFREKLLAARSADDVLRLFKEGESELI